MIFAISKDGLMVSDMREKQGIDHCRQKVRGI